MDPWRGMDRLRVRDPYAIEKYYTGNLTFGSDEARTGYLDLKRLAYDSGNPELQEFIRAVARQNVSVGITSNPGCGPGCGIETGDRIWLNPDQIEARGLDARTVLAHELGHSLALMGHVPLAAWRGSVRNAQRRDEVPAFYYETIVNDLLGCRQRPWDHTQVQRC